MKKKIINALPLFSILIVHDGVHASQFQYNPFAKEFVPQWRCNRNQPPIASQFNDSELEQHYFQNVSGMMRRLRHLDLGSGPDCSDKERGDGTESEFSDYDKADENIRKLGKSLMKMSQQEQDEENPRTFLKDRERFLPEWERFLSGDPDVRKKFNDFDTSSEDEEVSKRRKYEHHQQRQKIRANKAFDILIMEYSKSDQKDNMLRLENENYSKNNKRWSLLMKAAGEKKPSKSLSKLKIGFKDLDDQLISRLIVDQDYLALFYLFTDNPSLIINTKVGFIFTVIDYILMTDDIILLNMILDIGKKLPEIKDMLKGSSSLLFCKPEMKIIIDNFLNV